jgi:hypothetical protein
LYDLPHFTDLAIIDARFAKIHQSPKPRLPPRPGTSPQVAEKRRCEAIAAILAYSLAEMPVSWTRPAPFSWQSTQIIVCGVCMTGHGQQFE